MPLLDRVDDLDVFQEERRARLTSATRCGGIGGAITSPRSPPLSGRPTSASTTPRRVELVTDRVPMGRPAEPEEMDPTIAWLLGSEASRVTGAVLRETGRL